CLFQPVGGLGLLPAGGLGVGFVLLFLGAGVLQPGFGRVGGALGGGVLHLRGGGGLLAAQDGRVQQVPLLAALHRLLFQRVQLAVQVFGGLVHLGNSGVQLFDGGAVGLGLQLDALLPLAGAGKFGPGLLDLAAAVLVLVIQHGDLAVAAGVLLGD